LLLIRDENPRRRQAENPLNRLFRFSKPALTEATHPEIRDMMKAVSLVAYGSRADPSPRTIANHHDGGQSPPRMKGACGCAGDFE
jgi:hypothetical protein